jgi:hypothetical protein
MKQSDSGGLVKRLRFMGLPLNQPIGLHGDNTQDRDSPEDNDPTNICIPHQFANLPASRAPGLSPGFNNILIVLDINDLFIFT